MKNISTKLLILTVILFGVRTLAEAQTITILTLNGTSVAKDELFIPETQFPTIDVCAPLRNSVRFDV